MPEVLKGYFYVDRPHAPFEGKVDMLEVLKGYFYVDRPHAPFEGKVDMRFKAR